MLKGCFQIFAVSIILRLPLAKMSPQARRIKITCAYSCWPLLFTLCKGTVTGSSRIGQRGLDQEQV